MGWKDAPEVQGAGGWASAPEVDTAAEFAAGRRQRDANMVGGLIRGAGSLGATAIRLLGIDSASENEQRRKDMDSALANLIGADPTSGRYKVFKTGSEVAGTMGIGGVLAKGAQAAGAAPSVVQALGSSGFTTGANVAPNMLARAGDLGLRTAAGGVVGGVSAGAIDPSAAGTGATVGAVLPGVVQGVGALGSAAAGVLKSPQSRAAERFAAALEADPAAIAARLNGSVTLVPGSRPTAAQVLRTPQASVLEKVVSESPGGAALKQRYIDQNAARMAAVDRVAPVDPRGLRSVQEDFGTSALKAIREGDEAAKAATREAYNAVPQDEASLYLPQLAPIRDKFYPPGSFGARQAVDDAVNTARQIGTVQVPGILPTKAGKEPMTLAQAVRRAGGLSINNNSGVRGELAGLRGDLKNLIRTNGGMSPARMAETMHEAGYLPDNDVNTLLNALRGDAAGDFSASMYSDPSKLWRAQAEAAMGDAPGAQELPQKVTLRSIDALRKSIGNEWRAASRDPARATEAAALDEMRRSIDDRINEVVRGDGALDEVLPIEWADLLTKAQGLKAAQVQKFRTGPQAEAFKRGADNMPAVQGGEFASKVWGNRPGIANDIKQFRQIMDEKPELLRQFRTMVMTEGAGTATGADRLTDKFVKWVNNSLPGLKASFQPEQVRALERIAADIKRANVATAAGASVGSDTYQKASNALSLGLLDSPMLNAAANRIPVVNTMTGPALQWMRESSRERLAKDLADLLADPTLAGNALAQLSRPRSVNPTIATNLLRAAPVVAIDR